MRDSANYGDYVLFGRVPPGIQVGTIYSVPAEGGEKRRFCVIISMPKCILKGFQRVACVRYMVDPSNLGGRPILESDVVVRCSCSDVCKNGDCVQLQYWRSISSIAHNILCLLGPTKRAESGNEW